MAITLKEKPKSTCPFGVFHILLGSILCTKPEHKNDLSLRTVALKAQTGSNRSNIANRFEFPKHDIKYRPDIFLQLLQVLCVISPSFTQC